MAIISNYQLVKKELKNGTFLYEFADESGIVYATRKSARHYECAALFTCEGAALDPGKRQIDNCYGSYSLFLKSESYKYQVSGSRLNLHLAQIKK